MTKGNYTDKDTTSLLDSLGGSDSVPKSSVAPAMATLLPPSGSTSSDPVSDNQLTYQGEVQEVGVSVEEVQVSAKEDLDFLAALIMPLIFSLSFPPVFKSVWDWLLSYIHQDRIFPQLALGLPRGFVRLP